MEIEITGIEMSISEQEKLFNIIVKRVEEEAKLHGYDNSSICFTLEEKLINIFINVNFGGLKNGRTVFLMTICNKQGTEVSGMENAKIYDKIDRYDWSKYFNIKTKK